MHDQVHMYQAHRRGTQAQTYPGKDIQGVQTYKGYRRTRGAYVQGEQTFKGRTRRQATEELAMRMI